MNIKKEIQAFQAMAPKRKKAAYIFLAAVLFWWGMFYAPPSKYNFFLATIPPILGLLNILRVGPEKKAGSKPEGQE